MKGRKKEAGSGDSLDKERKEGGREGGRENVPWKAPRRVALVGDDLVLVGFLQRHVRQTDGR